MRVLNSIQADMRLAASCYSSSQIEVNALNASFSASSFNGQEFAPLLLGSLAGQFTRIAVLGLGLEVSTYELSHRLLSTQAPTSNLWESLQLDFMQFGLLRASGFFLKTENVILRHLFQDAAFVFTSQMIETSPQKRRSFAQRMLQSEIFNLSFEAALHVSHFASGGNLHGLGRALSVSRHIQNSSKEFLSREEGLASMNMQDDIPHVPITPLELQAQFNIRAIPAEGGGHKVLRLRPNPQSRKIEQIVVHSPPNEPRALSMLLPLSVPPGSRIEISIREADATQTHWLRIVEKHETPVPPPPPLFPPRSHLREGFLELVNPPASNPRNARVRPRLYNDVWIGAEQEVGKAPDGIVSESTSIRAIYGMNAFKPRRRGPNP